MKTFGGTMITPRSDIDGERHVLVATQRGSWDDLCRARPTTYETVEADPKPTAEPWVWSYERAKVTCKACLAMLDGATIEFVPVSL